jgi:hypothetical protein
MQSTHFENLPAEGADGTFEGFMRFGKVVVLRAIILAVSNESIVGSTAAWHQRSSQCPIKNLNDKPKSKHVVHRQPRTVVAFELVHCRVDGTPFLAIHFVGCFNFPAGNEGMQSARTIVKLNNASYFLTRLLTRKEKVSGLWSTFLLVS